MSFTNSRVLPRSFSGAGLDRPKIRVRRSHLQPVLYKGGPKVTIRHKLARAAHQCHFAAGRLSFPRPYEPR
jgi:hypothetical protein